MVKMFNETDLLKSRLEKSNIEDRFNIAINSNTELEELKTMKIDELKFLVNKDITQGFYSKSLNKSFDFKETDQINFSSTLSLMNMDDTVLETSVKTSEDEVIQINKTQFINLYKESIDAKNEKLNRYNNLKSQVMTLEDRESFSSITY